MTQDIVRQIEESIQHEKQFIELDKALDRLEANRDFKAVVIDGYLEKEAIRLVHLKADPAMEKPEKQASILAQIDAISHLLQYFRLVGTRAAMATKNIASAEIERDALIAGEDQHG